jgi:ABC-type bacteriocin/lantibiotic exporter with double-glycine peptidase domain
MKLQRGPGTCGAAVIVNCLRVFGKKIPQKRIESLAGTTPEHGTDENGILTALASLSYVGLPYQGPAKLKAIEWLDDALHAGPVILSVENGNHWVAVVGKAVDRYIVVDSTNTKRNLKENGIHVLSKKELLRQWYNKTDRLLYGIAVNQGNQ